jgi:hypothetical protein
MNYQRLSHAYLDGFKQFIGSKSQRWCRYCGRTKPDVTFRLKAHALPELIGNSSLIAFDECDVCNKFFSETIEDSFGKFLLPYRTLLTISGKEGVPTYQSSDKAARMEYDPKSGGFHVKDVAARPFTKEDLENRELHFAFDSQPFVPVRVLKCFAKMALALMPPEELKNFPKTMKWILERDDAVGMNHVRGAGCYVYLMPIIFPRPWVTLLHRVTTDTPLPYMLILLGNGSLTLQAHVPMTHMNDMFVGQKVTVPRFGPVLHPGEDESHCQAIPLDSAEWKRDGRLDAVMRWMGRTVTPKDS